MYFPSLLLLLLQVLASESDEENVSCVSVCRCMSRQQVIQYLRIHLLCRVSESVLFLHQVAAHANQAVNIMRLYGLFPRQV